MDVVAFPSSPRKLIASQRLAMQIVEQVAHKHDLPVQTALCAKRDRYAVICRGELVHRLKAELRWSYRRIGDLLGATPPGARYLHGTFDKAKRRVKNALPVGDLAAINALSADELRLRLIESEEMVRSLHEELDRLTGGALAHRLAEALGLQTRLRAAIVLAIVIEAYPDPVSARDMVTLYDEACDRLEYGTRTGASFMLIRKNVQALREHFVEKSWPDPIETFEAYNNTMRRLTVDAAQRMHALIGAPRISQIAVASTLRAKTARSA